MGVFVGPGTMPGGVTPICNTCGIALCWDISSDDYDERPAFWDAWLCQDCNGGIKFSETWRSADTKTG